MTFDPRRAGATARAAVSSALLLSAAGTGVAEAATVGLRSVGTFDEPVYVTSPPGSRSTLAVVERYGRVRLVRGGQIVRRPLIDLRREVRIGNRDETDDQRGLLSIAFAPDFRRSGRVYVDYIGRDGRLRVATARAGTSARPQTVLDLGPAAKQHHGGQLQFERGSLYVSTGIGDTPEVSQDRGNLGGKILRLDPQARPVRPEVYALGLRNPWRFSFHRGAMLIGDVGDDAAEEVDVVPAGAPPGVNFGWPAYEGLARRPATPLPADPLAPPSLVRRHDRGWCSIVGGYVGRDAAAPALRGRYVYGDVCRGWIRSARFDGRRLTGDKALPIRVPYLVSFGEDGLGRLYAVSLSGRVWRIVGR